MEERNLFITGGCRSGKSSYALREACRAGGENRIFLATSVPADPEMEHRVAAHRRERGNTWRTIEEPEAVGECIARLKKQVDVILVDCLTLWISNLLCSHNDEKYIKDRIEILVTALGSPGCPVLMVSNEVGCGIVPENSLSRAFRDMAGYANQKAAQTADRVIWMVSGIPVKIK